MKFLFCEGLIKTIRKLFIEAEQRIYICSPFIGGRWSKLLDRTDWNSLDLRFIVNFSRASVALGATNPDGIRELQRIGRVRNNEKLHAKLYIFDDKAIICSANLSQKAFEANIETGVLIENRKIVNEIEEVFCQIWKDSKVINITEVLEKKQIWKQAKKIRKQMDLEEFELLAPQIRTKKHLRPRKKIKIPVHRKHHNIAILFPANPKGRYKPSYIKVGDIDAHIDHLEGTGGVFWRLCQRSGKEEFPHKIKMGYIYDTSQKGVTYRVAIEKIVRAEYISKDEEKFIPKFRRDLYKDDLDTGGYWWLLIREFKKLSRKRKWQEFILIRDNRPVKRCVRILSYVKDPNYV